MSVHDRHGPGNERLLPGSGITGADARLAAVFKASQEGIAFLDRDGCVIACNDLVLDLAQIARGAARPDFFAVFRDARGQWFATADALAVQPAGRVRSMNLRRQDGEAMEIDISRVDRGIDAPEFAVALRPQRPAGTFSEQQAGFVQMARQVGMSAIGTAMAHELNQPLTAMLLYLQTVQRMIGQPPDDGLEKHADLIGRSIREAQRVAEIVKRIRDLAARREPARRQVDLEAVVDEAIDLSHAGRTRPVDVRRDYAGVGAVRIDTIEIQQVLVNLLSNAFDAVTGQTGALVTVRTRYDARSAYVSVSDTGPGVNMQLLERLFRPFETTKENGLGIGLSISQAIAHAHGGDLTVDPGGNGAGATFTLSLPLGDEASARADMIAPSQEPTRRARAQFGSPQERARK